MENFRFEELDNLSCKIVRPTIEDLEMYYAEDLISQSVLKYFLTPEGIVKYLKQELEGTPISVIEKNGEMYFQEKESFVIGSAADFAVTMGIENFYKKYSIVDIEEPTDVIKSMVHFVFDKVSSEEFIGMFSNYTPLIEEAIIFHQYYTNRKMETNVNSIIDKGSVYFQQLVENRGKIILTTEIADKVIKVANNYVTMLVEYIEVHTLDKPDVVIEFQTKISTEKYKGLIDVLIFDSDKNIHLIDFKSTYVDLEYFPEQFRKYRMDIQLSFYSEILGCTPKYICLFVSNTNIFNYCTYDIDNSNLINATNAVGLTNVLSIGKYGLKSATLVGDLDGEFLEFHTKPILGFSQLLTKYDNLRHILLSGEEVVYEEVLKKYFNISVKTISAKTFFRI